MSHTRLAVVAKLPVPNCGTEKVRELEVKLNSASGGSRSDLAAKENDLKSVVSSNIRRQRAQTLDVGQQTQGHRKK